MGYTSRLKEKYENKIVPALQKEFGYKNIFEVPKVMKISINMGVGKAKESPKGLENAIEELRTISGQKPVISKSKLAISNFKLRKGDVVGVYVTLRRDKKYDFLDKLISIAIPRIRDFRGIKDSSFDGRGNFSIGVTEQIIFPEIDYDKIDNIRGMDISIVTSAKTDKEAHSLLRHFGMPFKSINQG
ncbi:MAG: 50S ribosomal protein L5 [Candidatus Marinimicrobia bacterium]|nr:50S ribosomal protein L5 [Candidatus Neomarinimicrobiota bacterium]